MVDPRTVSIRFVKRLLIRTGATAFVSGFIVAFLGAAFSTPDVFGQFRGPGLWVNRFGLIVMLSGLIFALVGYRLDPLVIRRAKFRSADSPDPVRLTFFGIFVRNSLPVFLVVTFFFATFGSARWTMIWNLTFSQTGAACAATLALAAWWTMSAIHQSGIRRAFCIGALLPTALAAMTIVMAGAFGIVFSTPTPILPAVVFLLLAAPVLGLLCMGLEVLFTRLHDVRAEDPRSDSQNGSDDLLHAGELREPNPSIDNDDPSS